VAEDEIINFEITQEISQTQPHIEVEVAQNVTPVETLAVATTAPSGNQIEIR
jgi:hypothetical protein